MPDVIQIGNHAYALTLNLLVTVSATVLASIVFFKWKRRTEREEKLKKDLIEQRESNEKERHGQLVQLIDGRHDIVINKIEDYCRKNDAFHREFKKDFDNHVHDDDGTVIVRRGGM